MKKLPVIVGFGGINPAGRSSFHLAYKRMIIDSLDEKDKEQTCFALASMMNLIDFDEDQVLDQNKVSLSKSEVIERFERHIKENTLIRKINSEHFDIDAMEINHPIHFDQSAQALEFKIKSDHLPHQIPDEWQIIDNKDGVARIKIATSMEFLLKNSKKSLVSMAGQVPTGAFIEKLYKSQNHPRALAYAVYAASDMLHSSGFDLNQFSQWVDPNEIGVYASSATGQMDELSAQGYIASFYKGKRTSTKQMPFSFPNMPGDFINAYILGNVGHTKGSVGACATFLYNLESAVEDIKNGRRRIAIVGTSDAPIQPEVMEGYRAMSALSEDLQLAELDKLQKGDRIPFDKACRPFAENKGFIMGESAQYFLLFDEELALETGAQIFGSVGGVFINADGYKRSISKPGIGNYISMAQSCALARSIVGESLLQNHSFVHAHGTGTPQNRVSESHVLSQVASNFNIHNWPVTAVKSMLGHSIASASADQLSALLGTWKFSIIPGIKTIDKIADDVYQKNLDILIQDKQYEKNHFKLGFVNTKGFGGNNATALILSPETTMDLLSKRHAQTLLQRYHNKNLKIQEQAEQNEQLIIKKELKPIYNTLKKDEALHDIQIKENKMTLDGYENSINLDIKNPFEL